MKISHFLCAALLGLSASVANASTIFVPTDGNVNFAVMVGTFDLAIFDSDAAMAADDTDRLDVLNGDKISHNGPPVTSLTNVTQGSLPFAITGGNFIISAYTVATGWVGGIGTETGDDIWTITFAGISGAEVVVDIATIPVPAAAWLFGSGLLGLVAVSRRKA